MFLGNYAIRRKHIDKILHDFKNPCEISGGEQYKFCESLDRLIEFYKKHQEYYPADIDIDINDLSKFLNSQSAYYLINIGYGGTIIEIFDIKPVIAELEHVNNIATQHGITFEWF